MKWIHILLAFSLALLLVVSSAERVNLASAAPGGYAIQWWTVDGGGSSSPAGSGYALSGSIAQPDAQIWSGSSYTIEGGFWPALFAPRFLFLPFVRK